MRRIPVVAAALFALATAAPLSAQDWTPPSREMPSMPTMAQLQGDWRTPLGPWFRGVDGLSGVAFSDVRASGETTRGAAQAKFVRFTGGPRQVALWTDRNGDGRADLIEIYRQGTVAVQVIDADYDGTANVLRVYDASGTLARETRL